MTSLTEANFTVNMQWEAISLNSAGDKPDRLNRGFTVKCLLIILRTFVVGRLIIIHDWKLGEVFIPLTEIVF